MACRVTRAVTAGGCVRPEEAASRRPAHGAGVGYRAGDHAAQENPRGAAQERLSRGSLQPPRVAAWLAPRAHGAGVARCTGKIAIMKRICSIYKSLRKDGM